MLRKNKPRNRPLLLAIVLLGITLFAASCGSSNNPTTWAQAEADGTLEENFMRSCTQANVGGGLTDLQVPSYCGCAFDALANLYSEDFQLFRDAESRLRSDPTDIDPSLRQLFESCVPQ